MTFRFDMKRLALLALSLMIAFAVVGPACFVFVQSAFASHAHAPMSSSDRQCDGPEGSNNVCPHENEMPSTPAVSADQLHVDLALPATPVAVAAPTLQSAFALSLVDDSPPEPVDHLTPLRI